MKSHGNVLIYSVYPFRTFQICDARMSRYAKHNFIHSWMREGTAQLRIAQLKVNRKKNKTTISATM